MVVSLGARRPKAGESVKGTIGEADYVRDGIFKAFGFHALYIHYRFLLESRISKKNNGKRRKVT